VIQQGLATWAHAGDSRLYLIRGPRVAARTVDHSRVHHLVSSGLISDEDAKDHPERNRIYNCVGAYVAPTVEVGHPTALHSGDVVMLCSDGLWGALSDRQIVDEFASKTVMRAVPDLVSDALEEAGPDADNCTAVAMAWAGADAADMVPPTDAPVSTLVIPDGAVATTIQFRRAGEDLGAELTDDQIDEAVSEIQRAIQRATKLIGES
jgi:serine/threonine protein phosphatase PrpC